MTVSRVSSSAYSTPQIDFPYLYMQSTTDGTYPPPMDTTSLSISATAGRVAVTGKVVWGNGASSKNLHKVHWLLGDTTDTALDPMRISIRDSQTTALRPDTTVDQSHTYNGGSWPTANTWVTTTLDSDRASLGINTFLSVVWDMPTVTGGSSFKVAGIKSFYCNQFFSCARSINSGSTWTRFAITPPVLLEADDGTLGWFAGGHSVINANNTIAIYASATTNAIALKQTIVADQEFSGIWAAFPNTGLPAQLKVWDNGGNVVSGTTISVTEYLLDDSSARIAPAFFDAPVVLTAGTYYIGLEATSDVDYFYVPYLTVQDAAYRAPLRFGTNASYAARTSGTWSATTTRVPYMGLIASGISSGAGGGLVRNSGFGGGING